LAEKEDEEVENIKHAPRLHVREYGRKEIMFYRLFMIFRDPII
jgi:hypothetical protein